MRERYGNALSSETAESVGSHRLQLPGFLSRKRIMRSHSNPFRRIPAVDEVLRAPAVAAAIQKHGRAQVADAVRASIAMLRARLPSQQLVGTDLLAEVAQSALRLLETWNA